MELLIVRHAIAVERGTPPYQADEERPLTPRGVARFRRAAAGIARLLEPADALYTSPLVRAAETARLLSAAWDDRPAPEVASALAPGTTAAACLAWLAGQEGARLAVVGHEPNCAELLAALLGSPGRAEAVAFKKGGAALVEVGRFGPRPRATLTWFAGPRLLRQAGRRSGR